jgi:hypothetical protein
MCHQPDVEIRVVHQDHEFSLYSFTGLLLVFSFLLLVAIEISIGYQYWLRTERITYWFHPDQDVLTGANAIFSWAEDQSTECQMSVIADPDNESRNVLHVTRELYAGYAGIGKEFQPSFQLKETDVLEFSVRNQGLPCTFVVQLTEKKMSTVVLKFGKKSFISAITTGMTSRSRYPRLS